MTETYLRPTTNIRPFPDFKRPHIEGCFSVDSQRNYQDSFANLKYLNVPQKVNFNLNEGDETYVGKPASADEEKLSHLLSFILHNGDVMSRQKAPDFVCFRGLLRAIMSTPYDEREPWIVLATRFKGTIYLCAEQTQKKKAEKARRNFRDIKFMRFGFKFENCVLSDHPSKPPPGSSIPVLEAEEFCVMFSTHIGGKKILYGGETDGVISKKPCTTLDDLRKVPLVEVKVKRRETNERQVSNFYRLKARDWWLQSFLVGIDGIFVGHRNDDGIVEEVTRIPIKELSDEAKKNNFWHATVAVNFLNDFLDRVLKDMKGIDDPNIVFRYQWDTSHSDFVTKRELVGHRFSFLNPEFVESMKTLREL